MHDLVTGRSMTGILHLLNQTPIHWYSYHIGVFIKLAKVERVCVVPPKKKPSIFDVPDHVETYVESFQDWIPPNSFDAPPSILRFLRETSRCMRACLLRKQNGESRL